MPTFDCFALSDAGRDPDGNEDSCVLDERAGVFVIADGVGGRPGGARASRVAASTFVDLLRDTPPSQRLDDATLQYAVARVHDAVLRVGDEDENVRGLASTLSAVVIGRVIPSEVEGSPDDLVRIDGDIADLVPQFLAGKHEEIATMNGGSPDVILKTSHRLKGSFRLYGFEEAARLCGEIEERASGGRWDDVPQLVESLTAHLERMRIEYAR